MISIYNTIEGIITSVVLVLNGYISDRLGFQVAWLFASIFTFTLLFMLLITVVLRRNSRG